MLENHDWNASHDRLWVIVQGDLITGVQFKNDVQNDYCSEKIFVVSKYLFRMTLAKRIFSFNCFG